MTMREQPLRMRGVSGGFAELTLRESPRFGRDLMHKKMGERMLAVAAHIELTAACSAAASITTTGTNP